MGLSGCRRLSSSATIVKRRRSAAASFDAGSVMNLLIKLETQSGLAQASSVAETGPKQILLVDDDVALMRVIREALTSFLRCEVDSSPAPEYGFELALKKPYDLLFFDFSMPMIDGAMLFSLISKVYNNMSPPRQVPPLLLV